MTRKTKSSKPLDLRVTIDGPGGWPTPAVFRCGLDSRSDLPILELADHGRANATQLANVADLCFNAHGAKQGHDEENP